MKKLWSPQGVFQVSSRCLQSHYISNEIIIQKSQTNQDTCDGFHLYSAFTHLHLHHAHAHSHLLLIVFLSGSFELWLSTLCGEIVMNAKTN